MIDEYTMQIGVRKVHITSKLSPGEVRNHVTGKYLARFSERDFEMGVHLNVARINGKIEVRVQRNLFS